jgi:hypothetical protein
MVKPQSSAGHTEANLPELNLLCGFTEVIIKLLSGTTPYSLVKRNKHLGELPAYIFGAENSGEVRVLI